MVRVLKGKWPKSLVQGHGEQKASTIQRCRQSRPSKDKRAYSPFYPEIIKPLRSLGLAYISWPTPASDLHVLPPRSVIIIINFFFNNNND